ncbi:hypothetical protein OAU29_01560 [Porticoccaceae bacterium]|nr:hypothetical protein [Porticoccaceae bacterium]
MRLMPNLLNIVMFTFIQNVLSTTTASCAAAVMLLSPSQSGFWGLTAAD